MHNGTDRGEAYLQIAPDAKFAIEKPLGILASPCVNPLENSGSTWHGVVSVMAVMKPRTRMISVRLSQEEYSALRDVCSLTGARSVSDITRDAVRTVLRGANHEAAAGSGLEEFRAGIKSLERRVEKLEAKLTSYESGRSQKSDVSAGTSRALRESL